MRLSGLCSPGLMLAISVRLPKGCDTSWGSLGSARVSSLPEARADRKGTDPKGTLASPTLLQPLVTHAPRLFDFPSKSRVQTEAELLPLELDAPRVLRGPQGNQYS